MKQHLLPLAASLSLVCTPFAAAAPYASAVTMTGDTVTFILNEAADSVKVVFNEGASTQVIGASPEPAGLKTFSKAGFSSFRIEVEKNAGPGWKSGVLQQISQDSNDLVKFGVGSRGVSVNREPGSGKLFGRIYVSVGANATSGGRAVTDGIYVLNADITATSLGSSALGAATFSTASANSPYRITVGQNGFLFIADWSDAQGSVYMTDGDVTGAVNVFKGPAGSAFPVTSAIPAGFDSARIHGSIAAVATSGTAAAGDLKLWTIDEDLQDDRDTTSATQRNSVWEWNQGGDPLPLPNAPERIVTTSINTVSQTCDLTRGKDGFVYKLQNRSAGNESGVVIIDTNANPSPAPGTTRGAVKEFSRTAWQTFLTEPAAVDPLLSAMACDVSDDNWLAVMRLPDNAIHLVKVNDGRFDYSNYIILYTSPTTSQSRDISFDAAGNLYTVSSGQGVLRVYARGGHTLAKTHSNGTFEITEVTAPPPAPVVNPYPQVTSISQTGNDYLIGFSSQVGRPESHVIQRTTDMEILPWETIINPAAPAPAIFTITGTPPNYVARVVGAFGVEPRYFFRIRRN